jgi:cysteine synthase
MKDASVLPEEDSKKNGELFEIILEASLDRIRQRLKDKGKFVGPTAGAYVYIFHCHKQMELVVEICGSGCMANNTY